MAYIRTPSGNLGLAVGFAIGFAWRSADNILIIFSQRRSGPEAARIFTLALIVRDEYTPSRWWFGMTQVGFCTGCPAVDFAIGPNRRSGLPGNDNPGGMRHRPRMARSPCEGPDQRRAYVAELQKRHENRDRR